MINRRIWFIGLFTVTMGCANLSFLLPQTEERVKKSLFEEHLTKARTYEAVGDTVSALKQYKLVITLDPSNKEAVESRKRIEATLHSSARAHYNKGLQYHKEGRYSLARWQFLIALRLWPDYESAERMLTTRTRHRPERKETAPKEAEGKKIERNGTEKYTVHKIKSGESLAQLAKRYYGDSKKFPVIAKYNDIKDVTRVRTGQKIKIPKLEAKKASPEKKEKEEPKEEIIFEPEIWYLEEPRSDNTQDEEVSEPPPWEEKEAMEDQIAFYRDYGSQLFRQQNYEEAIVEFERVLNTYPDDEVALNYCSRSYFQSGKAFFDNEVYMAARDQFEAALRYNEECEECREYLEKSELLYKETHYKKGMQYYGKEQLVEAIQEWELVQLMDPNYKRVEYLINKSKTILKKLEEIKASEKEQE